MGGNGPDWTMSWDDPPPDPVVPHSVRARVRAGGAHYGHLDGAEIAYDRSADGIARWRLISPSGSVLELLDDGRDGGMVHDGRLVEDGLIPAPFRELISLANGADHVPAAIEPGSLTSVLDPTTGRRTTRFRTRIAQTHKVAEAFKVGDAGGFVVELSYQEPGEPRDWIRLDELG